MKQIILNGTFDNDPSAEKVRLSFNKVNDNFSELFDEITQNPKDVVKIGSFIWFKGPGNSDVYNLEDGDLIMGWWSPTLFIKLARFNGGNPLLIGSYTVLEKVEW